MDIERDVTEQVLEAMGENVPKEKPDYPIWEIEKDLANDTLLKDSTMPGTLVTGSAVFHQKAHEYVQQLVNRVKILETQQDRLLLEEWPVRYQVERFARNMEAMLRRKDWKSGWENVDPARLFMYLALEMDELREEFLKADKASRNSEMREVLSNNIAEETADVANFAMMLWEVMSSVELSGGIDRGATEDSGA